MEANLARQGIDQPVQGTDQRRETNSSDIQTRRINWIDWEAGISAWANDMSDCVYDLKAARELARDERQFQEFITVGFGQFLRRYSQLTDVLLVLFGQAYWRICTMPAGRAEQTKGLRDSALIHSNQQNVSTGRIQ